MFAFIGDSFADLIHRGGPVMYPLLALSVVSVTLIVERIWFFLRTNRPRQTAKVELLCSLLRDGQREEARRHVDGDKGLYGRLVRGLLSEKQTTDALAIAAIESQRPALERFMRSLSTIITAAPMLGILGTVIGIIGSFEGLTSKLTDIDPKIVGAGIAEALLTTAVGLVVAIVVLFPYNAFRAQIDRTLSRFEMLAAAAGSATRRAASPD